MPDVRLEKVERQTMANDCFVTIRIERVSERILDQHLAPAGAEGLRFTKWGRPSANFGKSLGVRQLTSISRMVL